MRTGEGGEANPVRMPEREQPGTEGEQGTCDQTSREEGSYAGGRVSRSASPTDGAWRSAPRSAFVDLPAAQVGRFPGPGPCAVPPASPALRTVSGPQQVVDK